MTKETGDTHVGPGSVGRGVTAVACARRNGTASALVIVALAAGCGHTLQPGGAVSTPEVDAGRTGGLAVRVTFPDARAEYVPVCTSSVLAVVRNKATAEVLGSAVLTPGNPSTTFTSLPTGLVCTLTATAHASGDGTGDAMARGVVDVTIPDGSNADVSLTMGTVSATVTISPVSTTIAVGGQTTLTPTARDACGTVVLVGGQWEWRSDSPSVCSVDVSGQASGLSWGEARVTARDSASGASGTAVVYALPDSTVYHIAGQFGEKIRSGDGEVDGPCGLAIDEAAGRLYVADRLNHRIQVFDLNGNFIAKWGRRGDATEEFSYPMYLDVNQSGRVCVSDDGNSRCKVYSPNGNVLFKWGALGGEAGEFRSPYGIAWSSDSILVADNDNMRVQVFDSEGAFLRMFGTTDDPEGLAIDSSGNVYVADETPKIRKFSSAGTALLTWGSYGTGNGQFNWPRGVAIDDNNYVYVADSGNHRVQEFNTSGGYVRQWGSQGTGDGQFQTPSGVATEGTSYVYVAEWSGHRVQKFTSLGVFVSRIIESTIEDGEFYVPCGIGYGPSGIVVADSWDHRVELFDEHGGFVRLWGSYGSGQGQFSYPWGVAMDSAGSIYVADSQNDRIQKFSADGTFLAAWGAPGAGQVQFDYPKDVGVASDGTIVVADTENSRIQKLSPTGIYQGGWSTTGQCSKLALAPNGDVYVADSSYDRVRQYGWAGNAIRDWGGTGMGQGQFTDLAGVAVDGLGYVYTVEEGNPRVQKFTSTGIHVCTWTLDSELVACDIAVDLLGYVYITDKGRHRVEKWGPVP